MEYGNRILFWFRENLLLEGHVGLCKALQESIEIIPVYCFDPRESKIPHCNSWDFLHQQSSAVSILRKSLQKRGSNLLVVHDQFEKIIPSLARVLIVNKVVTNELVKNPPAGEMELAEFRNQKALEVQKLLNMHSIPLFFEGPCVPGAELPSVFPGFPEINPGTIPWEQRY